MSTVRSSIAALLPRRSDLRRQRLRSAWLFLLPMLVVLTAVAGWPLVRTIYFGFTDASLTNIEGARWIGIGSSNSTVSPP